LRFIALRREVPPPVVRMISPTPFGWRRLGTIWRWRRHDDYWMGRMITRRRDDDGVLGLEAGVWWQRDEDGRARPWSGWSRNLRWVEDWWRNRGRLSSATGRSGWPDLRRVIDGRGHRYRRLRRLWWPHLWRIIDGRCHDTGRLAGGLLRGNDRAPADFGQVDLADYDCV